ncbi:MAG TPA: zinc ABC transporter substrate-binding protein, partial [Lentisphaeria bacterium]|nr:zinc ABC transporter substrate-binding protein [Lentisphaeria bacterium]
FAGRRVATYHRSWNYLLERFGIILAAELEPKPGIPPSARHLASLEKDFKEHDIRLILQEPFYSRKAADRLASRTGAAVLVCANSTHGSNEAESYLAMLDTVIAGLAQHLRP